MNYVNKEVVSSFARVYVRRRLVLLRQGGDLRDDIIMKTSDMIKRLIGELPRFEQADLIPSSGFKQLEDRLVISTLENSSRLSPDSIMHYFRFLFSTALISSDEFGIVESLLARNDVWIWPANTVRSKPVPLLSDIYGFSV